VKSKKFYFGFVDLEKAFHRVPTSPTHLSNHEKLANSGTINSSCSRVCGYLGVAVEGGAIFSYCFLSECIESLPGWLKSFSGWNVDVVIASHIFLINLSGQVPMSNAKVMLLPYYMLFFCNRGKNGGNARSCTYYGRPMK